MKQKERIYVCHTFYHVYITMLKECNLEKKKRVDKSSNKLYINIATAKPQKITIEYIPVFEDVSEIKSDYWIDIIIRLATAIAKVTLGRIRSRYTQSNALWTQDGQTMLEEGNAELNDIREKLQASTQLCYPID